MSAVLGKAGEPTDPCALIMGTFSSSANEGNDKRQNDGNN